MRRSFLLLLTTLLLSLSTRSSPLIRARNSVPGAITISQVYGAGGNSGATFRNDFVELINRGNSSINLSGWALQYTSSGGTSWSRTDLGGTIHPGHYFLVQLASGGTNGAVLPTPDAVGGIAMAATAGKIAVTNSLTTLTGGCPAGVNIVDLVGYGGSATCYEGAGPAPAPSNATAIRRARNGCQDLDQNSGDFSVGPVAPRNSSSPANLCSDGGGARFSTDDVKVSIADAAPCSALTVTARLTNTGNRAQRDNPGPEFFSILPVGLKLVPGSCQTTGSGVCTETTVSRIDWSGTVAPAETVSISWQVQLEVESAQPGDQLCLGSKVNYDGNDDGTNEATILLESCLPVTCLQGTPGTALPIHSEQAGDRTGSVLIFPLYSSSASSPATENTLLSLTSVNVGRPVSIHLFFVAEDSPSVADMFICLTASQTRSFLASDVDPNSAGYVVAVAVDTMTGCPISFNYLIGETSVKLASGHAASLFAEAFAALNSDPALCSQGSTTAELRFDGKAFNKAPRVVAVDSVPSPADGFSCLLFLNRLGGSLLSGTGTLGQINGLIFNDVEMGFSFSLSTSRRQLRLRVGDSFPRTTPRLGEIIPEGTTGWSKVWLAAEGAVLGATLVTNPQARISAGAHTGGRNLHTLSWTDTARLTMPVFPPSC